MSQDTHKETVSSSSASKHNLHAAAERFEEKRQAAIFGTIESAAKATKRKKERLREKREAAITIAPPPNSTPAGKVRVNSLFNFDVQSFLWLIQANDFGLAMGLP